MHAVLIVIHLFIAVGMVALILLQRSEGGALGMGGGPGGLMSGRAAGNVLTRATSGLALAFFLTSIALSVFAGANQDASTVVDRVDLNEFSAPDQPGAPLLPVDPAELEGAEEEPAPSPEAGVPIDD